MKEMQETWVLSLNWEDPLEEEMATHSSILAWRIPWTEEPDRVQSVESYSQMWFNTYIIIDNHLGTGDCERNKTNLVFASTKLTALNDKDGK